VLHLTKLPGFASFHTELKPSEEHYKNEYEFSGVAPPPGEASPFICAELVRIDLSTATVAHREPHISISTAKRLVNYVRFQEVSILDLYSDNWITLLQLHFAVVYHIHC
jgi:hypothetical protein